MRALAIFLTVSVAASAADKPALLTPKEIADGWVLLFDGESKFGLQTTGEVSVVDGKLVVLKGTAIVDSLPSGTMKIDANTASTEASARTGIAARDKKSSTTLLAYQPAGMKSIFNGKDLNGWKLYRGDPKREASKYEVTKNGELHVLNGPGDLQTEKQYGDFMLQFDCKTNGKKLNSGIFFRCLPNQYQQGYEAQIHNGYKDNDRTKPTDFGTGAIYRRVPTRKVVSNDKEWFAMTIMAVGPTIRTWVNGYPTACWTDERKPAENPRQGMTTKPGHISIQGHDPTTDILFRNIRIVEVKPK